MTSYIAGVKSISDYYALPHSLAWIYGCSGHALIMNIHTELCPSGPTFFSTAPINALLQNLGLMCKGTFFNKPDSEFREKQASAFTAYKESIDLDQPSLIWEMELPEYYLAIGYDDENYIYLDLRGETRYKKWNTLGDSDIGMVGIITPEPMQPVADTKSIVKSALSFALKFARHPQQWTYPAYANGTKAYDAWMLALQNDKVNPFGLAYNTSIWSECRKYAHDFLLEAKSRLDTDIFDNAIEHYEVVSWSLNKLAKMFPFPPTSQVIDDDRLDDPLDELLLAKEAEKAGMTELKLIIDQL